MIFGQSKKKKKQSKAEQSASPRLKTENLIAWFQGQIDEQEDILYGMALFFEGISVMHAGQDAVVETYRKQFRNLIQSGSDAVQQARVLLAEVRRDPGKAALLVEFGFAPCQGHPDPAGMLERAKILVATYNELFPGRPREQQFTDTEAFRLIDAAAEKLGS